MIIHKGRKWVVTDSTGKKVLGTHSNKQDAVKQLQAIEISKSKRKEVKENKLIPFKEFFKESFERTLQYHKVLNPKLWDGQELKPDVRKKLIEIGHKWSAWSGIPVNAIKDLIFVGGNANFNYTPYSDIDLHILLDKSEIEDCPEMWDDYLRDKKQLWSLTHDIKIYGHDVELYAQNVSDSFPSNQGVFSLTQNKWIQEPTQQSVNLDDPQIEKKVQEYINQIDALIASNADEESFDKLKNKFKEMRSTGIKSQGEFSVENLVFKELRNLGYLDKMSKYIKSKQDEGLSL